MSITIDQMRPQLMTLDQLYEKLAVTENLSSVDLPEPDEGKVTFHLPDGWNMQLKEAESTWISPGQVLINNHSHNLSKDAILAITTAAGITRDYVCKIPGELLAPHLNYWWAKKALNFRLLTNEEGQAIAAVKKSIHPFSNVKLVDQVVNSINEHFGDGMEVLVDYKFQHDLRATHIRLIIPNGPERQIASARALEGGEDVWSIGVEIRNSIIGEKPLSARGYMFAWTCTNGATSTHAASGNYNRRTQGQGEEVYEWVKGQVDSILSGLEHELDAVQDLVDIPLEGSVSKVMQSVFERYRVPLASREEIIQHLVDGDDLTAYGLMAAVTESANNLDLPFGQVASLLDIGGDLPRAMSDRCASCNRL